MWGGEGRGRGASARVALALLQAAATVPNERTGQESSWVLGDGSAGLRRNMVKGLGAQKKQIWVSVVGRPGSTETLDPCKCPTLTACILRPTPFWLSARPGRGAARPGAQLACIPGHTGSYLQMVKPRLARVGGGLLLSGSLSQLHKEPFLPPQALLHNNPGLLWPRFLSHLMCHLVTIAVIPGIASLTLGNSACCLAPSQTPGEIDRFGKIMATGGSWNLRLVSCVHGFL